ncbi:MAG: DUF998 domain-containing protein [Anaerolineae bacterium]|nr:DUF998 domain-containing protein [Anaerolineae bacterium]
MSNWSRRLTIIPGYVGTTVLVIATLVTALTYTGADGQRYSLLNHFVSELGHTQDSKLAAVFNAALVFGALMLGLHLVGVGLRFRSFFRYIVCVVGAVVGIAGALVGVFPMDVNTNMHRLVALGFFEGSLLLLIIFSLFVGLTRQCAYPRWMALLAIPMLAANLVFLNELRLDGIDALALALTLREPFRLICASEWAVILAVLLWVVVMMFWRARQPD